MLKGLHKNEIGSAAVIFAICITVFVGISATVIDAGLIYVTKQKLVNAGDSAALAGAQELPYNTEEAENKAIQYAKSNGMKETEISVEIDDDNRTIKVSMERNVELFFAKFLGHDRSNIKSTSIAIVAPISGLDGVIPLGIKHYDFNFGQEYTLKVGAGESDEGWFGALALGGPGASTYENNLANGYSEIIKVGDIINIETGNISNPTKRAIDERIMECTHSPYCTAECFSRDCRRLIKLPIINIEDARKVRVIGFAVFLVNEVEGQGVDNYIKGEFIKTVMSGEIDSNLLDYGLIGVKLIH